MNYKNLRFLIPALGAALLLSCQVDELAPAGPAENGEITPVTVSLQLSLGAEQNGTPQTRAIDDPADKDDTAIHNLCILQYNGTTEDATLVGEVHYLRSDVDPDDENYLDFSKIKLAASWGEAHTLVILTNTFSQLPKVNTLGEMLSLYRAAGGEPDVFGHTGQGESFPDDTDYYQRMSTLVVAVIEDEVTVKGTLHRSMARINVEIDNDGTDGLQIRDVQLRNVSMKDYYVTDYSYIDENEDVQLLRDTPFQDEYLPGIPMRADYKARTWPGVEPTRTGMIAQPAETGANPDGTGVATYRWYVPSNMRGTSGNTLPSEKNMSPNASGATYLYILGRYGTDADGDGLNDELIVYRFYLGANLTDDFNLKPDHSYTYRFTFRGKGNTVSDRRVDDYGTVHFNVDANCYIVNPPVEGTRKYTFNVVHRPNIFWGGPNSGDRYGYYNNQQGEFPANYIATNETWHARILWSDVAYDMNAVLTRQSGDGDGGYMDARQRVELTIPSDITEGNMVIGVWAGDDPSILWSWHIWITDYQPDDIVGHAPDADTFVYNVEGGEVHRYNNAAFNTGVYKNGYAMDRNLGALNQKYVNLETSRGGGLYYEFGRKDPFPGDCTAYTYDSNGVRTTKPNGQAVTRLPSEYAKNVPKSVNNPLICFWQYSWTNGDIFNPSAYDASIRWQDPMRTQRTDNEELGLNGDKSFFDPCPAGWRVPTDGWANGFVFGNSSTTSMSANFIVGAEDLIGPRRGNGGTYFPYGFLEAKNHNFEGKYAQTCFFPMTGNRDAELNRQGILMGNSTCGYYRTDTPVDTNRSIILYFDGRSVKSREFTYRANAQAVRCVRK